MLSSIEDSESHLFYERFNLTFKKAYISIHNKVYFLERTTIFIYISTAKYSSGVTDLAPPK